MSPAELKTLNIRHFQQVRDRTADPLKKARLERLIVDERAKPDSAYPQTTRPPATR